MRSCSLVTRTQHTEDAEEIDVIVETLVVLFSCFQHLHSSLPSNYSFYVWCSLGIHILLELAKQAKHAHLTHLHYVVKAKHAAP